MLWKVCCVWSLLIGAIKNNLRGVQSFHSPAGIRRNRAKEQNNTLDEMVQHFSYLGDVRDYGTGDGKGNDSKSDIINFKVERDR